MTHQSTVHVKKGKEAIARLHEYVVRKARIMDLLQTHEREAHKCSFEVFANTLVPLRHVATHTFREQT